MQDGLPFLIFGVAIGIVISWAIKPFSNGKDEKIKKEIMAKLDKAIQDIKNTV